MGKLTRRAAIAAGTAAILGGPAALAKAEKDRKRAELLKEALSHPTYSPACCEAIGKLERLCDGGNRSGATLPHMHEVMQQLVNEVPLRTVRLRSNP